MSGDQIDQLCINTIRTLSIDAIQKAKSGHPGTPMALAPLVYTLWNRILRFDPQDPIRNVGPCHRYAHLRSLRAIERVAAKVRIRTWSGRRSGSRAIASNLNRFTWPIYSPAHQ